MELSPVTDWVIRKGEAMRKTLMAVAAVATLAISAAAPAHAQRDGGAGVAAGLIGGAIVGGALAGPGYYYGPGYYGPGYGYGGRPLCGGLFTWGCALVTGRVR